MLNCKVQFSLSSLPSMFPLHVLVCRLQRPTCPYPLNTNKKRLNAVTCANPEGSTLYFLFNTACVCISFHASVLLCAHQNHWTDLFVPLAVSINQTCKYPCLSDFCTSATKTQFINQSPFHVLAVSLNMCGCVRARASPISSYSKPSKIF